MLRIEHIDFRLACTLVADAVAAVAADHPAATSPPGRTDLAPVLARFGPECSGDMPIPTVSDIAALARAMREWLAGVSADSSGSWFVGTCGIADSDWNGNFYPKGLRTIDRLSYYASRFNSIELNTTFHAVPLPKTVRRWASVTPSDFRFSVKFPKAVTHQYPERLLEADTLEVSKRFFDVIPELNSSSEDRKCLTPRPV